MNPFISRTDIAGSLEDLLVRVADTYKLGSVRSHKILPDGYQELNILLDTSGGRFVVKIFSKDRARQGQYLGISHISKSWRSYANTSPSKKWRLSLADQRGK
ncbi:MAG: hypothetical protein UY08_C0002G0025 [Candidatus Gottesmanbacteria bacterium GW2011_GWA1_47_8]|uniref:Uncharacterized protein n=1 Tax=Candidatus Gottesmanbacteria bacterium GW2011_GWA1_47_8 TaxID=1618438 RepID=A0A0G1TH37_9BACT|nr:MAG: hypothetical protein UY08_C0002G0025 [Candidatus Gottesmanbacteria bacterium GW2011_GWA1_47_8]